VLAVQPDPLLRLTLVPSGFRTVYKNQKAILLTLMAIRITLLGF